MSGKGTLGLGAVVVSPSQLDAAPQLGTVL